MTVYNDKLYFIADGGTNSGREIWSTDGTNAPSELKDIYSGVYSSQNSFDSEFIVFDGKLYFAADDGTNGNELWLTEGTEATTVMFKNINPGSGSSHPYSFAVFDGKLYFQASDGTNGIELWWSDGTVGNTVMYKDINSGASDGLPQLCKTCMAVFNSKLYFIADDGSKGFELYVVSSTSCSAGYFLGPGSATTDTCELCTSGKYQASNNYIGSSCTDCPPGTYMDVGNDGTDATEHDGEGHCKQCEKGKYQDQTGQTSCFVCGAGKYRDTPSTSVAYDSGNTNNANLDDCMIAGSNTNNAQCGIRYTRLTNMGGCAITIQGKLVVRSWGNHFVVITTARALRRTYSQWCLTFR